jgi:hypothetical protein
MKILNPLQHGENMVMQRSKNYIVIVSVIVIIILAGTVGYLYGKYTNLKTETMTETTTISETITTTITATSNTTSTTTFTSSKFTTMSNITSDSYNFSSSTPLKIQSVWATITTTQNGERYITFYVEFENVGNSTVYIVGGCGSGLDLYTFTNSSVLQKIPRAVICLCPQFIISLSPGQNHTSTIPGCWSGYYIKLLEPGKATINFAQNWSTSSSGAQKQDKTLITASFTFTKL